MFLADFVLPGSGMVLDILRLGAESSAACASLEQWPFLQVHAGEYNGLSPGNRYDLREGRQGAALPGWHAPEADLRWTAARRACFRVLIAPGECQLHLRLASFFNGPYEVEVWIDDHRTGVVRFDGPGEREAVMEFPPGDAAERTVCLQVPHLWRPPAGNDPRALGIAFLECWLTK
jgi:hypothetical protein